MYDHDGNEVTAEDVLDREELADYYRSRRNRPPRKRAIYTDRVDRDHQFYDGTTQPPPEERS